MPRRTAFLIGRWSGGGKASMRPGRNAPENLSDSHSVSTFMFELQ